MKLIHTTTLTCGLALLTMSAASAQTAPATPPPSCGVHATKVQAGPGGFTPADRLAKMTTDLNLTPAQVTALTPILQSEQADMKAVHEKYKAQINAVLTPDQLAKLKAMHKDHFKGNGANAPAPPPAA